MKTADRAHQPTASVPYAAAEEQHLSDYFRVLYKRRWVALRVALQDLIDESLVIERVREAFACINIVERRLRIVHADQENPHCLIARDVGGSGFLDVFDLIHRQVGIGHVE